MYNIPFVLGRNRSRENDILHIFVLSENLSDFPNNIRFDLVRQGTAGIKNVVVHEIGNYMVYQKCFHHIF